MAAISPLAAQDAQDDFDASLERQVYSQFGLNTTDFFSRIIGAQNPPETGPVDLFYKICWPKAKLRFGLGFQGKKTKDDETNEDDFESTLTFNRFNFVFGFQQTAIQGKRFGAYWGIDLVNFYSTNRVKNNFFGETSELETKSTNFGLGPILGVTFKISEHFHLNTESTIYLLYNETKRTETFDGQDPVNNDPNRTTGFEYSLQAPLALFLNYTF